MSPARRIFLNVVATYGRSLYALALGLFSGRWALTALGQEDYGLYGVVGGLTFFLSFFNTLSAAAVSRFYAFEVGRAGRAATSEDGTAECRKWFNTALLLHVVVPLLCTAVGYPVGEWAVRNWLAVSADRIEDCVWVFRLACLACFVSMLNVPFQAMYVAKQCIAELTVYGLVSSTLQACFLYYIASHPSDWLVRYSVWTCLLAIAPQLLICVRAMKVFPECRVELGSCWDAGRVRRLASYAGWQFFGTLGGLVRGQGLAVLVNKCFGARANAAMSIANTVNGQAGSLASALLGAFSPAIVQAYGAGNHALMRSMAFRACKFGMLMVLLFSIPLGVEIDNVMTLWLKAPPPHAASLCLCMLLALAIDKSTSGHLCALNANGRIALYQMVVGGTFVLTLPLAWLFVKLGGGVPSVGIALVLTTALSSLERAWFARRLVGMRFRHWAFRILLPVAIATAITVAACLVPRLALTAGFMRLCLTSLVSICALVPLAWRLVLQEDERAFVRAKVCRLREKFR